MEPYREAIERFQEEFAAAAACGLKEPSSVTLSTSGLDARPTIRTVLLKSAGMEGFTFFTNLESRKGRNLLENPRAAMCFYWGPLEKQVIVEGTTSVVSDAEADAYWETRPRDSQIGAWASTQSRPLAGREEFLARITSFTTKFGDAPVPRPPHWSGVRLAPDRLEFWKGMPFRLHERTLYEKTDGAWRKTLLYP